MATIPGPDAEFDHDIHLKVLYVNANLADLGLTSPDVAPLTDSLANWDLKYPEHLAAQEAAKIKREDKDDARFGKPDGLETVWRALRKRIASFTGLTNAQRAALGIPIAGEPEHPAVVSPPTSRPVGKLNTSERLRQILSWIDEMTGKKAKPSGINAAEIWIAITAQNDPIPPVENFEFLALDTESPYVKEFDSADAGKVANYIIRWVHRDGSTGSWSEIVRATIVG